MVKALLLHGRVYPQSLRDCSIKSRSVRNMLSSSACGFVVPKLVCSYTQVEGRQVVNKPSRLISESDVLHFYIFLLWKSASMRKEISSCWLVKIQLSHHYQNCLIEMFIMHKHSDREEGISLNAGLDCINFTWASIGTVTVRVYPNYDGDDKHVLHH